MLTHWSYIFLALTHREGYHHQPFYLMTHSPQVILVVPSSQMQTPINNKKAKIFLAMGVTQLTIGIVEIVFNIGATVMMAELSRYVGPGYWGGILVSSYVLSETHPYWGLNKMAVILQITYCVHFLERTYIRLIQNSLKFVPIWSLFLLGSIDIKSALVYSMVWYRTGAKPFLNHWWSSPLASMC